MFVGVMIGAFHAAMCASRMESAPVCGALADGRTSVRIATADRSTPMYRTELEPQPLNPRGVHRFQLLVVALLAFSAGAASDAYLRAPVDGAAGAAAPTAAPTAMALGLPRRDWAGYAPGPPLAPCVWVPRHVSGTSTIVGSDCVGATAVPAQ
jgi:hypothetical protein